MAKLRIVKMGDETLRKVCRPVDAVTPRIVTLLDDMIETMREADGCGLAAPQVGVLRRIAVVEVEPGEVYELINPRIIAYAGEVYELINPRIIAYAGEQREQEGCLSIPGRWGITKRPKHVTVRAMNRKGEIYEVSGSDLLARAFCHEIDHLDGKLFVDDLVEELDAE